MTVRVPTRDVLSRIAQGDQRAIKFFEDLAAAGGAGGGGGSVAWADVTGKPSFGTAAFQNIAFFAAAVHGHAQADVTNLVSDLAGKSNVGHTHTPAQVGILGGVATITAANNSREVEQTVAATGVTGSMRVLVSLAATTDADENEAETLEVAALMGRAGTDQITFSASFLTPVAGPILLNWSAMA